MFNMIKETDEDNDALEQKSMDSQTFKVLKRLHSNGDLSMKNKID